MAVAEQQTREEKSARKAEPEPMTDTQRLHALQRRIRAGLNSEAVDPRDDRKVSCRACYQRGWVAALKMLLEE